MENQSNSSKTKKPRKTSHLHLRLSEKEKEAISKKANLANLSLTAFVLKSTGKVEVERLIEHQHRFMLGMELGKELNKIGVNINQLAKMVNTAKHIQEENVEQFFSLAKQIEKRQRELLELLNY